MKIKEIGISPANEAAFKVNVIIEDEGKLYKADAVDTNPHDAARVAVARAANQRKEEIVRSVSVKTEIVIHES